MNKIRIIALAWIACTVFSVYGMAASPSGAVFENEQYRIRLVDGVNIEIRPRTGSVRLFTSEFTVLSTDQDPKKSMRRPDVGFNQEEKVLYKVPTWGREALKKIDPAEHVMDGFDPATDRELENGRTANYYLAAPN